MSEQHPAIYKKAESKKDDNAYVPNPATIEARKLQLSKLRLLERTIEFSEPNACRVSARIKRISAWLNKHA